MKLSMSMLKWYLKKYEPDSYIKSDSMNIRGMRFLSDESITLSPEYVYFGNARSFFYDEKYENAYIIVTGQSRLMFFGCDYEELLNALLGAFDYFITWENRLLEAASRHAPLQELTEIAFEVIQNSMVVGGNDLASAFISIKGSPTKYDPYWSMIDETGSIPSPVSTEPYIDHLGRAIHDLTDKPQLVQNVYRESDPVMMMYIYSDKEPVGTLSVKQDDPSLTEMNAQLFPILGGYFSQAAEFTAADAGVRSGVSILRDLLTDQPVSDDAVRRFEQLRLHPPYRLLCFRHETRGDRLTLAGLLNTLQRLNIPNVSLELDGKILCAVSMDKCDALLSALEREFDLSHHAAGVSMPLLQLRGLPAAHKQAMFALDQLGGSAGVSRCENHAFNYLIGALRELPLVNDLLHPAIAALEQHDTENQSELEQTLRAYLMHDRNLISSAEELNIHKNTLKYRLKRIREITGIDTEDKNQMDYLTLSYRIRNNG